MIEQAVPAVIAIVTGGAVLFNRVHNRMHALDRRIDNLELRVVESFVPRSEFSKAMEKMEEHLIRIETKMDKLVDRQLDS